MKMSVSVSKAYQTLKKKNLFARDQIGRIFRGIDQ